MVFSNGRERMIRLTAVMIANIPKAIGAVKGSLKTIMPMQTAVKGSMAPKTDVNVEPMWRMA